MPRPDKVQRGKARPPAGSCLSLRQAGARTRLSLSLFRCTHLSGGGEAFFGPVAPLSLLSLLLLLLLLSLPTAGPGAASVDSAGSWIDAWLPWRWFVNEATVEVDDGREMSWPMDGRGCLSSNADAVLKAGRSNTCRMDGRRNASVAWGRGRMDVANAEAVV